MSRVRALLVPGGSVGSEPGGERARRVAADCLPRLRPAAADPAAPAPREGELPAMRSHPRLARERSPRSAARAHPDGGHHLRHRQCHAVDGPVGDRALGEHDDRRWRLADVARGRTHHRRPGRVLRGAGAGGLSSVHADTPARRAAHAGAVVGRRNAALGASPPDLVDARGDAARHSRRADQDRGARHRRSRDRLVRGRRAHPAHSGHPGHLRSGGYLAAGRMGRYRNGSAVPATPAAESPR